MGNPLSDFLGNQVYALRSIRGNPKAMLLVEPMFAIPFGLVCAYASLYQKALGLSPWQIGLIGSIGNASAIIWSLLGGHITDRFGRRRTLLIADLVGWTVAISIWAFARNFWHFLLAALINSIGNIAGTAWTCLLIEDTKPENRMPIFTVLQIIGILAGFFVPLAGLTVNRFGLIPATRIMYLFFLVSLTSMMFIRNALTKESSVGRDRIKETEGHSWSDGFRDYLEAASGLLRNRIAMALLILNSILALRDTLGYTFTNIYINGVLGISPDWIAAFPTISSFVQLAVLAFSMGMPSLLSERLSLWLGLLFSCLSLVLMVMAPFRGFTMLVLSTIAGAAGGAILVPALGAAWNNSVSDNDRAKLNSVLMLILAIVRLPAGWIAGVLYGLNPRLPFAIAIVLTLSGLLTLYISKFRSGVGTGVIDDNVSC